MFEFQSKYQKKVLVWALISTYGGLAFKKTEETLTADSYIAQVLEQAIAEQELLMKEGFVFQQDNVKAHTAKKAMHWFEDNNVEVLQWPAQSPDINIIEQVWWFIKVRINNKINLDSDVETIFKLAEEVFYSEDCTEFIQSLYQSLPERIQMILNV